MRLFFLNPHVEYPDFKRAVEGIVHDLGGRAASDRQSATIYLGKSKWSLIAELLSDPEYMAKLGCATIPASVSVLKKHKQRSERSLQPKISDAEGQLNVSSRKVLKLLLPTEVEQPNGYQMNKGIKELEQFGMLNADLIDENNRDDKANWQLDNLYRKLKVLQECFQAREGKGLRFREENGAFDAQAYDRAMKSKTHDMITATGYRPADHHHERADGCGEVCDAPSLWPLPHVDSCRRRRCDGTCAASQDGTRHGRCRGRSGGGRRGQLFLLRPFTAGWARCACVGDGALPQAGSVDTL